MLSNEHDPQFQSAAHLRPEAGAVPGDAMHFEGGSGNTSLTALSSDWYWEQDTSLRFTKVDHSPSANPLEGISERLMIGHHRWDMPGARALNTTWDQHRAQLQAWKPFRDFQYVVCPGSHGLLYLSSSGEPVFDGGGRFAGYRGTARDITAHRVSEQRLCDAQALLQMAVKAGPVGSWSIDLPSLEFIWSSEACAMLEVPAGHSRSMEDAIDSYAPEHRGEVRIAFATCISEGTPFSLEAQIITARQRRIWVSTTGQVEHDATGVAVRVRGALQDIAESRQTERDQWAAHCQVEPDAANHGGWVLRAGPGMALHLPEPGGRARVVPPGGPVAGPDDLAGIPGSCRQQLSQAV